MILITSAAYVSPALISEFGKLPPTMLPVQNRRLFEHQLDLINDSKFGRIFLTLPNKYDLTEIDKRKLKDKEVTTIKIPEDLTLGQSIVYALNVIGRYNDPLYLLHGDTLFSSLNTEEDIFATNKAEDDYSWAIVKSGSESEVYSGFFSFSSISLLIQKITENNYHFISGLTAYQDVCPMKGVRLQNWMDFGLINSYYRSVAKLTTQRVFNSLKVNRHSLTKFSKDSRKILAEANWFSSLPREMRHYAPALWDSGITEEGCGYYEIEYYYQSSLANLFVFGKNPPFVWEEIINSCIKYINEEALFKPNEPQKVIFRNARLYGEKTFSRLKDYAKRSNIQLNKTWSINGIKVPSLLDIAKEMDAVIDKENPKFATLMHGDFCFSNILYDFKSKSIRVIDPRGLDTDGHQSIYGDLRYDVAKLAHSILGMYDFIIGDNFNYEETNPYEISFQLPQNTTITHIQRYFSRLLFAGYSLNELATYPILVHLFLSMLPLHSDNKKRQKALLANALRLYIEYKKNK